MDEIIGQNTLDYLHPAIAEVFIPSLTFVLAWLLALYLTPILRRGAMHYGIVDAPDGRLKTQRVPVAYLGGIAVYLAFLITLSLTFDFRHQLLGMLLGATLVTMLGLFDDLHVIPPGLKLVGQILASWALIKSGVLIDLYFIPYSVLLPLTAFWVVGITNAVNITDVSDGLATGSSAISAFGLSLIALLNDDILIAVTGLGLAGALIGFLRFNKNPASIYLGDAGSLFIGFMLAALAMIGEYTDHTLLGIAGPLFILIVPLTEISLVTVARIAKGMSPLHGSKDHFAVRLKHAGYSTARVAFVGYAMTFLGVVCGIGVSQLRYALAPYFFIAGCALYLAAFLSFLIFFPAPTDTPPNDAKTSP